LSPFAAVEKSTASGEEEIDLIENEERQTGTIKMNVHRNYFRAAGRKNEM